MTAQDGRPAKVTFTDEWLELVVDRLDTLIARGEPTTIVYTEELPGAQAKALDTEASVLPEKPKPKPKPRGRAKAPARKKD